MLAIKVFVISRAGDPPKSNTDSYKESAPK